MSEKRPAEEEIFPAQRYTRFKLASPSPEKSSESDTESIHSFQGHETELVKDTSDTSSSPTYNIEYEITDTEEQKGKFYFSDDTDEQEGNLKMYDTFSTKIDDNIDNAFLGDTSEENSTSPTSNSDVDPGLPRNDYLDFEKCLLCKTDKKDISYPYCSNCFKWKKNFFPTRPKKRQKSVKKKRSQSADCNKNEDLSGKNESVGQCLNTELGEDSGVGSSGPQLSEDAVDGPSQEPSTSRSTSPTLDSRSRTLETCRVCFQKPENGLFVHIKTAHVYGCYDCAKKIWYNSGGCPICRRKVFKVARLFV